MGFPDRIWPDGSTKNMRPAQTTVHIGPMTMTAASLPNGQFKS